MRVSLLIAAAVLVVLLVGGILALAGPAANTSVGRALQPLRPGAVELAREVVFVEQPDAAKAVEMLEAGELHVYASGLTDAELGRRVRGSRTLTSSTAYGSSTELTFNPSGPVFAGTDRLNPFHVPAIREAMNWLVDRNYIAQEIYGGLAKPRYFTLTTAFPDYARVADVARALEIEYAPDPAKAMAVINREMERLGAVRVNGMWHFRDRPVELIFVIRTDDERREVGDYVATLLQQAGFAVDRQYKTPAEASRIWIGTDPAQGSWHLYTGGWSSSVISRDQAGTFSAYYTSRGRPDPLWQAYTPTPEFDRLADVLARRAYSTLGERQELLAQALRYSMTDSVRVWLTDRVSLWPYRSEVAVTADLAGGVSGSYLWPYTLRFTDNHSGRITIGSPSILTEPWNPVAGTNWIFDQMILRATSEFPVLPDPYTGLALPQRAKHVEVTVEEGLPVSKTQDWIDLRFAPSIQVPADAWIDWDERAQRFITVGEQRPGGLTARMRAVVQYPDDLFQGRWHDGTPITMADALLGLILAFDRAREASALYDEAEVSAFETFAGHFRGARIVQENPLIVEIYSDQVVADTELMTRSGYFFPGDPWHATALGILAETNRELAFSQSKADRLRVDWMNYIAGPSLAILERHRAESQANGYVPYAAAIGKYVGPGEAAQRYEALGRWYREHGHFLVGNGPFYVHSVHPVEKVVVLRRSEDHMATDERWLGFTRPAIADVDIAGPSRTERGSRAEFSVKVSVRGESYPAKDVEFVKALIFDARGQLVATQPAEPVRDGEWRVALTPEQTGKLEVGSNRIEAIVVSKTVSIPSFGSAAFVTR